VGSEGVVEGDLYRGGSCQNLKRTVEVQGNPRKADLQAVAGYAAGVELTRQLDQECLHRVGDSFAPRCGAPASREILSGWGWNEDGHGSIDVAVSVSINEDSSVTESYHRIIFGK
jgi:hypothetical protein